MVDRTADGWRLRLLSELKKRRLTYRVVAEQSGMQYSTVQKHLSGSAQFESLWFVRNVCRGCDISMPYVLFGVDSLSGEIHRVPLLTAKEIKFWLTSEPMRSEITTWLPYPTMFSGGLRVFGWLVVSSDLAPRWPAGSMLYIDPDKTNDGQRHLVLARLPNKGLLVRWLENMAGEDWLVPETEIHSSVLLGRGKVLGSVIGGVKSVDL